VLLHGLPGLFEPFESNVGINVRHPHGKEFVAGIAELVAGRLVDVDQVPLWIDPVKFGREVIDRELRPHQCLPRPPPVHRMPDLGGELGVERSRLCALLQVEIRAFVQRLDDHLLSAPPGQQDEGKIGILGAHRLEQGDAVHPRHVVIGNDTIVRRSGQFFKGFLCRFAGIAFNIGVILFKKGFRQGEEEGFVIDDQQLDH